MPAINSINNRFLNQPVTTTAINYTALTSDVIIEVTSTAVSRTISLPTPTAAGVGKSYLIKDISGGAFTNNILIVPASGLIDGSGSAAIGTNYGSLSLYCDGTNYYTQAPGTSLNTIALAAGSWAQYNSVSGLSGQPTSDSSTSSSTPFVSSSRLNFGPTTTNYSSGLIVGTNNVTITQAGTYRLTYILGPSSGNGITACSQIVKNSTTVLAFGVQDSIGGTTLVTSIVAETITTLAVNDILDFRWSNNGSSTLFFFEISIQQIPAATSVITTNSLARSSWNRQSTTAFIPGSTVINSSFSGDPGSTVSNAASRIDFTGLTQNLLVGITQSQFQLTILQAGVYQIQVDGMYNLTASSANSFIQCVKNGTTVLALAGCQQTATASLPNPYMEGFSLSTIGNFIVGDFIDFRAIGSGNNNFWALGISVVQVPTAAVSQVVSWNAVSGTTQILTQQNGYYTQSSSLTTLTLPLYATAGTIIQIGGVGAGGWTLAQNAGQVINFGNRSTTTGTGGSISSTNQYDGIELLCVVANTQWIVLKALGNLTIV